MIRTIIYDVSETDKKKELAITHFSGCGFPQKGDNIVVGDVRYVVQRKEYVVTEKTLKDSTTHSYTVGLQVKKYIPEQFGF